MINDLDYEGIKFPVSRKDYCRIERQNSICINVFCYKNNLTYPVYGSEQKFECNSIEDGMDLLLISNENKSHYVYIKDSNRFMRNKTKNRIKNILQILFTMFSSKNVLQGHEESCLIKMVNRL